MAQRCRYRWKDAFPSVAKFSTILLEISIFVNFALCNDQFDQLEHEPFFSLIECSINDTALQIDKSSWITIVLEVPKWLVVDEEALYNQLVAKMQLLFVQLINRRFDYWYRISSDQSAISINYTDLKLINVKVMNWTMNKEEELKIDVVAFYRCSTLSAKSLVQDVTLMTKIELHALIGFSILTIETYSKISRDANVKSWILIISLSSIFSILFLGWFILFAYYNTCACMVLRKLPDNTHSAVAMTKKSKFPKLKTSSGSNDVDQQIIPHSAESSDNDKKLEVEADDAAQNASKMDWSENKIVISDNLQNFVGKHCTLGVDEAGRGPVLGPMVYACGVCVTDNLEQLSTLKAKDSKTLTEDERSTIFKNMQSEKNSNLFAYTMKLLSPVFISKSMLGRSKYNLNEISHDTAMELIQIVCDAGVVVDKVILDTVGPTEKYEAKLKKRFPKIDILVSKKADSLHTIVSAASICAKVTRDNYLSQWSESSVPSGQQFGSGYPSDSNTVAFLNNSLDKVFGFHSVVRFSWSTAKQLLDTKCVPVVWEDNENNDEVKQPSRLGKRLTSYFQSNKADNIVLQRHAFFEERCISSVEEI
ncbi:Ribonuclease H2 subunit A [Trichinella pseudospiralis]|uniref:Ribonuclease n=2 Tax=Trichinella pseudospiralis TaxID=6337 RepID=A0A0V1IM28_TRIPS|nr:Ribonuclease H2 subunit A [Trichinella pseudospiralis]KRZ44795.1 Ribonuclease H2 subunit A [Trichinella pseudospiralis]